MLRGRTRCLFLAVALLCCLASLPNTQGAAPQQGARPLKRQNAKRWANLKELVQTEIKVATRKFVEERFQRLAIPLEIDVLTLGLDGDGAYHYYLDPVALEETLAAQFVDRDICPIVWETGHATSTCMSVSFVHLQLGDPMVSLNDVESAINRHMKLARVPEGASEEGLPVYEVDAAAVQRTFEVVLSQAYAFEGLSAGHTGLNDPATQRLAVIVINPSKQRMNPLIHGDEGHREWLSADIMQEWSNGQFSVKRIRDVDAHYTYRYTYNGVGTSAAWVSSKNFIVIDLSAGPTAFGPFASPEGHTSPTELPRLRPLLESLAHDVEGSANQISLNNQLRTEALTNHKQLVAGQLASVIGSATQHVFLPDIAFNTLEMGKSVLVNLMVLRDHLEFNLLEDGSGVPVPGVETVIDLVALQDTLNNLLPAGVPGVVLPADDMLYWHPEVMNAMARARISWSDAVVREAPYSGLHRTQHSRLDSQTLLRELERVIPMFSDDSTDTWELDEGKPHASLASSVKHNATRQLHVLVLSLKTAPPGLMFENGQLVAASGNLVVVLQLIQSVPEAAKVADGTSPPTPSPTLTKQDWDEEAFGYAGIDEANEKLKLYSGHIQDGVPLEMHGAAGVTARITAGMAMALAGVTYPWEKANPEQPTQHAQDWRWSVGCLPWGPYANCTTLSGVLAAAARRNYLISHIETALQAVQSRLDAMDEIVEEVYQGPWMDILGDVTAPDNESLSPAMTQRRWIDLLSSRVQQAPGQAMTNSTLTRLQSRLDPIETTLSELSWALFSQETMSTTAGAHINHLLSLADDLAIEVDEDIYNCQEVAACCAVRHKRMPMLVDVMALVILSVVLVAFAVVAYCAVASQKVYKPPVASSSRANGSAGIRGTATSWAGPSGSQKPTTKGLLPLFQQQKQGSGLLLPR